jgi:hypothetical protein
MTQRVTKYFNVSIVSDSNDITNSFIERLCIGCRDGTCRLYTKDMDSNIHVISHSEKESDLYIYVYRIDNPNSMSFILDNLYEISRTSLIIRDNIDSYRISSISEDSDIDVNELHRTIVYTLTSNLISKTIDS